jgi:hypothetical protein
MLLLFPQLFDLFLGQYLGLKYFFPASYFIYSHHCDSIFQIGQPPQKENPVEKWKMWTNQQMRRRQTHFCGAQMDGSLREKMHQPQMTSLDCKMAGQKRLACGFINLFTSVETMRWMI